MRRTTLLLAFAGVALGALVSGCTQGPAPVTATATQSPAPGSAAVKTVDGVQEVTIEASEFKFAPAELTLKAGRTKFIVPNRGAAFHEFLLYPQAQAKAIVESHQTTMAGGGHGHEHGGPETAILIHLDGVTGGKSMESDIVDLKPGTYEAACLLPGHYEAGMKGRVVVTG